MGSSLIKKGQLKWTCPWKRLEKQDKYIWIHFCEEHSQSVSSVTQSCPILCNSMDCSTPALPVHHQLMEFTQTHVRWVSDAIQPSHPLLTPSPPAFYLSQHQCLSQWVSSLHQVAKVLEFWLQHQSFQWTPRTDFLWDGLIGFVPLSLYLFIHSFYHMIIEEISSKNKSEIIHTLREKWL